MRRGLVTNNRSVKRPSKYVDRYHIVIKLLKELWYNNDPEKKKIIFENIVEILKIDLNIGIGVIDYIQPYNKILWIARFKDLNHISLFNDITFFYNDLYKIQYSIYRMKKV
jgi:hypothetical protein